MRARSLASTAVLIAAGFHAAANAQQVSEEERLVAEFQAAAESYRITEAGEPLELVKSPIMNWNNPARNNESGLIFLWQRHGVPRVVGTVFTFELSTTGAVRTKHAFHSLADGPLSATWEGNVVWQPRQQGLQWKLAEGEPAGEPRLRLVQMRSIARRFTLRQADDKGHDETLRLLPQPLHQYTINDASNEGGAIFAFAFGTDPEALLLIESHDGGNGLRYRYAFARFNFISLQAKLDGETVWSAEPEYDQRTNFMGKKAYQGRIYTTMLVSERPAQNNEP